MTATHCEILEKGAGGHGPVTNIKISTGNHQQNIYSRECLYKKRRKRCIKQHKMSQFRSTGYNQPVAAPVIGLGGSTSSPSFWYQAYSALCVWECLCSIVGQYYLRTKIKIALTRRHLLRLKRIKIGFILGICPRSRRERLRHSPYSLAGNKGPYFKGKRRGRTSPQKKMCAVTATSCGLHRWGQEMVGVSAYSGPRVGKK